MKNLKLYKNNCKEEVLSKIALQKKHAEYTVGKSLFATTDVGKMRDHQEDSVMIVEHPKNNEFKLIGVSDGVGGLHGGDLASNHVAKKLILWFENLDLACFEDIDKLKEEMIEMLRHIMEDSEFTSGSATLSTALIGKYETLILNIGDSRIYSYKDGKLMQLTEDDSEVQRMYYYDAIPAKELMRFHKKSNYINQAIDKHPYSFSPKFKVIKNYDYDRIYAFTDGVTDCLSDQELENIIKASKKEATHRIVKNALEHDSFLWEEISKLPKEKIKRIYKLIEIINSDYYHEIPGGKDNTTAAEYRKR